MTISLGSLSIALLILTNAGTGAFAYYNYQLAGKNFVVARSWSVKAARWYDTYKRTKKDLDGTKSRLDQALKDLDGTRSLLDQALKRLGTTEAQLKNTQGQLSQTRQVLTVAEAESQRRLGIIFSQQENVEVLKKCLGGVSVSQDYFNKGVKHHLDWIDYPNDYDFEEALRNYKRAAEIMQSVETECDRAYALF